MINIIFNYIFELTLESKSECIVENNIYHLVIFKNVFASVNFICNQSLCRINIFEIFIFPFNFMNFFSEIIDKI